MERFSDIGAAVIGSGFIGTVHIEALRRLGVNVRGVIDATPELAEGAAARLGLPHAYPDLEAALADPDVDIIHVTSPNQFHYPQVKAILAAGKHVICEKPLAVTSDESRELVALAAALTGHAPRAVAIGIGVADLEMGEGLSPSVEAALPRVVEIVARLVTEHRAEP